MAYNKLLAAVSIASDGAIIHCVDNKNSGFIELTRDHLVSLLEGIATTKPEYTIDFLRKGFERN